MNVLFDVPQNEVKPRKKAVESWDLIIQRKKEAKKRDHSQDKVFKDELVHKESIHAKLIEAGARGYCMSQKEGWMENFGRCQVEEFWTSCSNCGKTARRCYRCCLKWCPCCNWRVTQARKKIMEKMTVGMSGVKHLVLTQKNFEENLTEEIRAAKANLFKLRQRKMFGAITGGAASLEVTKEKKGSWKNNVKLVGGWHLHFHILLQARFLPMAEISAAWAKYVGQKFAICRYTAVDDKSYLQEVCKYVVKSSDMAKWQPKEILEFVLAMQHTRCFGTFGKFSEIQKFVKLEIEREGFTGHMCECGCETVVFGKTESEVRTKYTHEYLSRK